MAPACEPLCHFGDRLYFTTFPHPAPPPHLLNSPSSGESSPPRLRATTGAPPTPEDDADYFFFTFDSDLIYLSFFEDWGPLNLAMVYRSCIQMHELLQDQPLSSHRLVLYTSTDPRRKANAALLMALYVMIVQRKAPWEAFHPIAEMEFMPFRDAGRGKSDFNLSIQDCLWGLWKAMQHSLCDLNEFSVEEYEYYEKVENGDWNWITPNFIAFASPVDPEYLRRNAVASASPARTTTHKTPDVALQRKLPPPFLNCLDYFDKKNVKLVVRLNNPLYDKTVFEQHGMEHLELYFDDGTNPDDEIVRTFIDVSEKVIASGGVVAVHCKAGLGRTGTLIGAYLIYKHGFTANEAIAFMRVVRPGSVVGPQQQYMYVKQVDWAKWAAVDQVIKDQASPALQRPVTPPSETSYKPLPPVPPVTPSRHVALSTAAAGKIAPPGQPRKTPTSKRVAVEPTDSDDDMAGTSYRQPRNKHARTESANVARDAAPSRLARPTTRATAAGAARRAPPAVTKPLPHRPAGSSNAVATVASARRGPPRATSPSPTPSRLPTLVPSKRSYALSPVPGSPSKGRKKDVKPDAWISSNKSVQDRSKLSQPLLRGARRRRSSFSAAES